MLVALGVFSLVADASTVESLIDRAQTVLPEEAATLLRDSLRRSTGVAELGHCDDRPGPRAGGVDDDLCRSDPDEGDHHRVRWGGISGFRAHVCSRASSSRRSCSRLPSSSSCSSSGPHLEAWIGDTVGAPTLTAWLWWTLQWPVLVAGLLFAFAVVLYLGPDVDRRGFGIVSPWRRCRTRHLACSIRRARLLQRQLRLLRKTWGTLATVVITLVWLWLTSAAVLFGAEVNAAARPLSAERTTTR